ncbi:HAD family hydrolase [Photobacterium carnosum]|uniref:HAD family hydrolase n=1 Tax=Photobacterium carnosum TaxID=2023717 RepID=UPI001E53F05D|nr:HAD family phosphatase [Photobacterium carnosum]MCD9515630.1 HAD-IA family hydrolase [Photobacterium carnosum]
MLGNYKAALFDMDGTLIDSKPVIELAWTTIAFKYGININNHTLEQHIHGRSGNYSLSYLFGHFPQYQQLLIKKEVDLIEERAMTELIPGAKSILMKLKNNGIRLGLVTASWPERIDFILNYHNIKSYFDCIISRDDVINNKPDPEGFKLCAKKMNISIDHCIIFEDSLSGLYAGINSGAKCIGINTSQIPKSVNLVAIYKDYLDINI